MSKFRTVGKTEEIPIGEGRAFEVGDRIVAIFNDQGSFRAIDDMCPHMGASLAGGHFENGEVSCPWHAWRFDVNDGSWCENRRLKIDVFEIRVVDRELQILVDDNEEPIKVPPEGEDSDLFNGQKTNVYDIATDSVIPNQERAAKADSNESEDKK